jgi:alpha-amylase
MSAVCLVLRAHDPWRLRHYNYFDVGRRRDYFDGDTARRSFARLDEVALAPAVETLRALLDEEPMFSCALALSGSLLEELARHAPSRLEEFRRLVSSGRVEPLSASSHRRMSWPCPDWERAADLAAHRDRVARALGREPRVFGGEEPSDPDELARLIAPEGFAGIVAETSRGRLPESAPARMHDLHPTASVPVLLADSRASADLTRRVSRRPAGSASAADDPDGWISPDADDILCVVLDLAALGRNPRREGNDFAFLRGWASRVLGRGGRFVTPWEAFASAAPRDPLPTGAFAPPAPNELQRDALAEIRILETSLSSAEPEAAEDFRRLASDDVLDALSLAARAPSRPEGAASPYETYMALRFALSDVGRRLRGDRLGRAAHAGPPPA